MKRITRAFALMTVLSMAGAPLQAQRSPSPEDAAKKMLEQRTAAVTAVRILQTDYKQTAEQVVQTLVRVGFPRRQVGAATFTSLAMDAVVAAQTLKRVGFSAREVADAALDGGVLVELNCIGPDGYPMPCGTPGGGAASAMGTVTVIPDSESYTDSILTLVSTNIPNVQVLLAGQTLQTLQATSTQVRVRLPSTPVTGPLVMKRVADGVEGVLDSSYSVKKYEAPLDWMALSGHAFSAAVEDIQGWLGGAQIREGFCHIAGPIAVAAPGAFASTTGFQGKIAARLALAGAPTAVAQAWDDAVRLAWGAWAEQLTVPGLPWYPAFAMFSGPQAPAVPNAPTFLAMTVSGGINEMSPLRLAARLADALGSAGKTPEAEAGITAFAGLLGARFAAWLPRAPILNVMGWGPVPAVVNSGGQVPAGPVQGLCSGTGVLLPGQF